MFMVANYSIIPTVHSTNEEWFSYCGIIRSDIDKAIVGQVNDKLFQYATIALIIGFCIGLVITIKWFRTKKK